MTQSISQRAPQNLLDGSHRLRMRDRVGLRVLQVVMLKLVIPSKPQINTADIFAFQLYILLAISERSNIQRGNQDVP